MDTVTNLVTHLASELSWFLTAFKAKPLCFEVSLRVGGNTVFIGSIFCRAVWMGVDCSRGFGAGSGVASGLGAMFLAD